MIGIIAPMVRDGPINGNWFEAYAGQVAVSHPGRGDVVLVDKLRATNLSASDR